jgi:acyl-CoA synthetase (NDP forming)/GNAT superfamily N-acetyltransferase
MDDRDNDDGSRSTTSTTPTNPPNPTNPPTSVTDPWHADVVLSDGGSVRLRPITPADGPALEALHARQSSESLYYRYFSAKARLTEAEVNRFTNVDMVDRVGLVVDDGTHLIAWASYDRWPGRADADVAFLVDEAHRGRGIATMLFEHLAAIARANGMERFTAEVLAGNRAMLATFARAGWPIERELDSGVVDVVFDLQPTDEVLSTIAARERKADSRAVARIVYPRSLAVIGASDEPGSVGAALMANLRDAFDGVIHVVNPNHESVDGRISHASITEITSDVHVAIVAVPPPALDAVLASCIEKRVRGVVFVTAVPHTPDWAARVADWVAAGRRHGMRFIGPGSMGVMVTAEGSPFRALLAPASMRRGGVAVSLQGGPLGSSFLERAARLELGLSAFVSLGDKADLSGNDLLQFFDDDENTSVVAMYTESFGNPRKFARIARRVARHKPVVAVRVAHPGESGALDALYQEAGVIRVETVRELLDTARVLASQPVPAGPRLAIVSNATSPLVLARSAAEGSGLEVTRETVLDWNAAPAAFADAVRTALAADDHDALLMVHAPPVAADVDAPAAAIDAAAEGADRPVLAVLLGRPDGPAVAGSAVPAFEFPEPAVAVLARGLRLHRWREEVAGDDDGADRVVDSARATAVIDHALAVRPRGTLLPYAVLPELFGAYGIGWIPSAAVTTRDAALAAAEGMGFPVALKALGVARRGRTRRAGLALDLGSAAAVREAWDQMAADVGAGMAEALVQRMVGPGVEVRVCVRQDPQLGPVLHFGLGGVLADAIGDQVPRLVPFGTSTARAMVSEARAASALADAAVDVESLVDLITRVSRLVADHPSLDALDLNPVIVNLEGSVVAEATVHVAPVPTRSDVLIRKL